MEYSLDLVDLAQAKGRGSRLRDGNHYTADCSIFAFNG